MEGVECHLEVDERVVRQRELELGSSDQQFRSGSSAQLGEQHAEPSLVAGRRLLAVDGEKELVTIDPAEPVEHEVGKEQMAQSAGKGIVTRRPSSLATSRPQSWIRVSPVGSIAAA